jgi:hypothetical protein
MAKPLGLLPCFQETIVRTGAKGLLASAVRRWMKQYRDKDLAGLADAKARSYKGKLRRLPADAIISVEGFALQTPRRSSSCYSSSGGQHCNRAGMGTSQL